MLSRQIRAVLSGSSLVKSEIVVPIFVKNKLAAELDIESHFGSTFTKSEQDFLEACATIVGKYWGRGYPRTVPIRLS